MVEKMDLNQQIQVLIDEAPHYGVASTEVEAIAPALKAIAAQLKHPQYYVLQTPDQGWLMTTIANNTEPELTKNVIYGFPTLKDVTASTHAQEDPRVIALPIPIAHILFQMLAMKPVDSIVFFETPGNLQVGTEITRENLMALIQIHLQKFQSESRLPPDIA